MAVLPTALEGEGSLGRQPDRHSARLRGSEQGGRRHPAGKISQWEQGALALAPPVGVRGGQGGAVGLGGVGSSGGSTVWGYGGGQREQAGAAQWRRTVARAGWPAVAPRVAQPVAA